MGIIAGEVGRGESRQIGKGEVQDSGTECWSQRILSIFRSRYSLLEWGKTKILRTFSEVSGQEDSLGDRSGRHLVGGISKTCD